VTEGGSGSITKNESAGEKMMYWTVSSVGLMADKNPARGRDGGIQGRRVIDTNLCPLVQICWHLNEVEQELNNNAVLFKSSNREV